MIESSLEVLLVEDNPGDVFLVEEMLRSAGEFRIELRSTNRISEARGILSEAEIDAVLLDLDLPDVNGLETLEKIQRDFPEVPIVVLSSLQDEEKAVLAIQNGAKDFLVKGTINGHLLSRSLFYAIKRKEIDSHLFYLAHHDPLTGAFNRKYFYDLLDRFLENPDRAEKQIAVILIDLVNFRAVNDTYGQSVGDEFLLYVSRKLQEMTHDAGIVARLGGDEFAIALEGMTDTESLSRFGNHILETMSRSHVIDSNEIDLMLSIGVSLSPPEGTSSGELVRTAGRALQYSRESVSALHFFSSSMDQGLKNRNALRRDFARSLKKGDLVLYFQPVVNIRTWSLVGTEALVRWNHPEKGLLLPGRFLPGIQGTELIVSMGDWVIDTALRHLSQWLEQGLHLSMSVNVELLQLRKPDFVARLETLLSRYPSVPRHLLELEIVETSTAEDFPGLPEVLHQLHSLGVRLAIDDFGTGYSSLSYLKNLPVDILKIDQGFVIGMRNNRENLAIIESIVSLARIFGRGVVAEGMEEMEYLPLLRKLGCDYAQGNALGPAMSTVEFLHWKEKWISGSTSESLLPASNLIELSILSTQVMHFSWIQRILSLVQKSTIAPLTSLEEGMFYDHPLQGWYAHEGPARYGKIPAFRELDNLYRELQDLAQKMLHNIHEKNLVEMHYDTHRMLLSKDSLLSLYGTLQKDAIFRSILDRKPEGNEGL